MSRGRRRTRAISAIGAVVGLCTLLAAAGPAVGSVDPLARAPKPQLDLARVVGVPGGAEIVRYRQRVGGLAVLDAELVVADPAGAPPILVADTTARGIEPRDPSGAISKRSAARVARAATGSQRLRARPTARLGIDPRTNALAWEVSLPSARPLADYLVVIDALEGDEIRTRDLLWNATASAAVFDPNPIVAQGSYEGLSDRRDRDSKLLTNLRVAVELPRITSAKGCLSGSFADARLGRKAKRVCERGLDFSDLTRADNEFEAVMSYFHVDRTRAYVEGLDLSEALRQKPQRVRANGIPDDNSFYSSMTRSMTLGTGGVDDAEDADVIVHEYGHSLQDQAVPGFGRSLAAGSIGEGFGDYVAAMMSSLRTGGNSEFDACIFDWDGISYSDTGCGRRADRSLNLERAERRCFEEIHCLGEVWSSALLDLRTELATDFAGRSVMDRVVLESNFMLSPRTSFKGAARALIAADELLYAGVHVPTIEAEMVTRKFCRKSGC